MKNAAIHIFINFIAEWLIENRSYDANELKGLDLGVGIDRGYFHLGHLGKKILIGEFKEEDHKTLNLLSETIATKKFTDDVKYQKIFKLIGQALVSDKATEKAKKLIAKIFMSGKNPDEKTFMLLYDELVDGKTTNAINETTNEDLKKEKAVVSETTVFAKELKKEQESHELSKSSTQKKPRKKSKKQSISDGKKSKKKKSKKRKKSNTKDTDKLKIKKDKQKKSKRKKSSKKSTKYLSDGVSGINLYENER